MAMPPPKRLPTPQLLTRRGSRYCAMSRSQRRSAPSSSASSPCWELCRPRATPVMKPPVAQSPRCLFPTRPWPRMRCANVLTEAGDVGTAGTAIQTLDDVLETLAALWGPRLRERDAQARLGRGVPQKSAPPKRASSPVFSFVHPRANHGTAAGKACLSAVKPQLAARL